MATTFLALASFALALAGLALAAVMRDHVPHGAAPTRLFATPAALFAAGAAGAWVAGGLALAAPLAAAAVLFAAAAWTVMPTPRSRFAQFERQFRAYVRHGAPRGRARS